MKGVSMKKILIAYFSPTGNTKKIAAMLAEAINVDIYEIRPAVPYSAADLSWTDPASRSSVEMKDRSSRPALADTDAKADQYDVILLGFPIWWYVAPTIINSFLESYDLSGKRIILFATSGGSDFGKTVEGLLPSVSETTVIEEGRVLNGTYTLDQLSQWADTLDIW